MASLSQEQRSILDSLQEAFSDVPLPGDDRITELHLSVSGEPCEECAEISRVLAGRHWRDYLEQPYQLLGYFPPREPCIRLGRDFIPLLTVAAFHFFLPVIVAAILVDPNEADLMLDSVPSTFDPGPRPDEDSRELNQWTWRHERCKQLLAMMSESQRLSILKALRSISASYSTPVSVAYEDAIENLEAGTVVAWKKGLP